MAWCLTVGTPTSRLLPQNLTVPLLVQKFPGFYWTRMFVTAFIKKPDTCAYFEPDQPSSRSPSNFMKILFNIILPSMPGSSKWPLSLRFPHKIPVGSSPLPHKCLMAFPFHSSWFDPKVNICWGVQIIKLLVM